jgi:hypothetical protein
MFLRYSCCPSDHLHAGNLRIPTKPVEYPVATGLAIKILIAMSIVTMATGCRYLN